MISKPEAADSLREVERVHRRTGEGSAYAKASPHLLLGGLIWTIGYGACGLLPPERWGLVWGALGLAGLIGSYAVAYASQRTDPRNPAVRIVHASRILWMIATTMAFIAATFLLFRPSDPLTFLAFPALLMAFVYVLLGSLGLSRFRWLGAGMFALLILGLITGREAIAFWVAAVGGGGLILGGFWLRKA
jgi:hypothetical protein